MFFGPKEYFREIVDKQPCDSDDLSQIPRDFFRAETVNFGISIYMAKEH